MTDGIGAYLARQRALRGIELDELAAVTRIPRRSLERLESGAFDADPDGFARGFVRAVAAALGLSPDDTVARMLPEATEADRSAERRARARRALRGVALLAVAGGLALALWGGLREAAPFAPAGERDGLVYRRDAVRELAIERGLLEADAQPDGVP